MRRAIAPRVLSCASAALLLPQHQGVAASARRHQIQPPPQPGTVESRGVRPMSPRERMRYEERESRFPAPTKPFANKDATAKRAPKSTPEEEEQQSVANNDPFPDFGGAPRKKGGLDFALPGNVDAHETAPGDTFGLYETRMPFLYPVRPAHDELYGDSMEMRRLCPVATPPEKRVSSHILRSLTGTFGVDHYNVGVALRDANFDVNECIRLLESRHGARVPKGSYGLVAIEKYDPETFCIVNYSLPSYEALQSEDLLEKLYEVTLSAAEMPLDTPLRKLPDKLTQSGWETEDGEHIGKLLKSLDVGVVDVIMLPQGEFTVHGFFVQSPLANFPNFGSAASAVCIDLRSGIHTRFRQHAERIGDTVAEHVVQEALHVGCIDDIHLLRQPYWFRPEFSVEDFLRFKESLMQPSFLIHELRHCLCAHHALNIRPFRNISELEMLKTMQYKLDKNFKEGATPGKVLDSDTGGSQVLNSTGGAAAGASYHNPGKSRNSYEDQASEERMALTSAQIITADERVWSTFYRKNQY